MLITRYTLLTVTLCLYSCVFSTNHTFYIVPPNGYNNEILFDMHNTKLNRDDCMRPFYYLRETLRSCGYELKTTLLVPYAELNDYAGLIVCELPTQKNKLHLLTEYPIGTKIFVILEPPVVARSYYEKQVHEYFDTILIMLDDFVDNQRYIKLYYPQPTLEPCVQPKPFEQKKLLTLISGNKKSSHPLELYSERKKAILYFQQHAPHDFEFYGTRWPVNEYPCYRGTITSKHEILVNYKFCLCYENMRDIKGYVTEKIFDAMLAGCIPVYLGATNITDHIDQGCFIARNDFASEQELHAFLTSISEQEYQCYLDRIATYLKSEKAHRFSKEYFTTTLLNLLAINSIS